MEFSTFDIIIVALVVLMSFKGFINGFMKEFFGFIGLIGGIFIASRGSEWLAKYIDSSVYHISNFATLKLIGFVLILALVWGMASFIGAFFSILPSESRSTSSKLAGMGMAGVKYFFIFALITSALFNNPVIKDNIADKIKNSQIYPTLDRVGSMVIAKQS
jgi:membrane protein required for colicin V production